MQYVSCGTMWLGHRSNCCQDHPLKARSKWKNLLGWTGVLLVSPLAADPWDYTQEVHITGEAALRLLGGSLVPNTLSGLLHRSIGTCKAKVIGDLTHMLLVANLVNKKWCKKPERNGWNAGKWVLIWEFSARAFQWIPTRQGLDDFQWSLRPKCALDESSLSIGSRVNLFMLGIQLEIGVWICDTVDSNFWMKDDFRKHLIWACSN